MAEKVQLHSTLDRPYTILSPLDPRCEVLSEQGRMIAAFPLSKCPDEIDQRLEFDGQVIHVYEDGMLYVFEISSDVDLTPQFQRGEIVDVVGSQGKVRWKAVVVAVSPTLVITSCGRRWTSDGKLVSYFGAFSDLQLRRRFLPA